jgi:GH25 family lysozyme M1 (1,4-beta-N-acetylmuramidase)
LRRIIDRVEHGLGQSTPEEIMAQLEGVDVYHKQGVLNWAQARDAGIAFALIKTTQGNTFTDPRSQTNHERCREVGIVPGGYHFYRHDVDPEKQAAYFLDHLPRKPGDLIPAIDVEAKGDGAGPVTYSKAEVVRRLGVMVDAVKAAIGRAPMIYTYPSAWVELTGNSREFTECPLWIARYGVEKPTLVGGWTTHAVWQYTDQGKVKGIGSGVDRDRLNGGEAELAAFRLGRLEKGGKAVFSQNGKVRSAPGVGSPEVAELPGGTRVSVTDGPQQAGGRDWWKIDDGAGTTGWSSSRVLSPA